MLRSAFEVVCPKKKGHQSGGLSLFRSEGTQLRLFARETPRIISAHATGHFDPSQKFTAPTMAPQK
jgi:hypothetical protein